MNCKETTARCKIPQRDNNELNNHKGRFACVCAQETMSHYYHCTWLLYSISKILLKAKIKMSRSTVLLSLCLSSKENEYRELISDLPNSSLQASFSRVRHLWSWENASMPGQLSTCSRRARKALTALFSSKLQQVSSLQRALHRQLGHGESGGVGVFYQDRQDLHFHRRIG